MIIKVNIEQKQVIVESGHELKLSDIFNFLHEIDADNVDQWTVVTESVDSVGEPYIIPNQFPPLVTWEITCNYEDIDSSGSSQVLEGANISSTLRN